VDLLIKEGVWTRLIFGQAEIRGNSFLLSMGPTLSLCGRFIKTSSRATQEGSLLKYQY